MGDSQDPFWQRLLLEVSGPLAAAIVGTLIVGLIARSVADRAQERRAERALRESLLAQMTAIASSLYLELQHFWRLKSVERVDGARLSAAREVVDAAYLRSRLKGEILERRLEVLFADRAPVRHWHATMDLLTVRYFQLVDLATDNLRRANAYKGEADPHSFLSEEELKVPKLVLAAYHVQLRKATAAVVKSEPTNLSRATTGPPSLAAEVVPGHDPA